MLTTKPCPVNTDVDTQRFAWDVFYRNYPQPELRPVGAVAGFVEYLQSQGVNPRNGISLGSGLGANEVLVAQSFPKLETFVGLEFSGVACMAARQRAEASRANVKFVQQDMAEPWNLECGLGSLDFVLDCLGTASVPQDRRKMVIDQTVASLRPGGHVLLQTYSFSQREFMIYWRRLVNPLEFCGYANSHDLFGRAFYFKELREYYPNHSSLRFVDSALQAQPFVIRGRYVWIDCYHALFKKEE